MKMTSANRNIEDILHAGEIEAQGRFDGNDGSGAWDDGQLNQMFRTKLDEDAARFIQSLPFFFIATSDKQGNCDSSYRGCEFYEDGRRQPPVKVMDPETMLFPDFSGNKLFNSLGNMLVNPQIGMLFIDFDNARRLRVNGKVKIIEDANLYRELWPGAQRYVEVTIEQVFGNCGKRIPKLYCK